MTQQFNPFSMTNPSIPVSPLSLKNALNWTPRIAAHVMCWFTTGSGNATKHSHLDIGYNSNDPATIAGQVAYLRLRGVDVAIFDWYGKDALYEDSVAKLWAAECLKQGMNFAICFDKGMFLHNKSGMDNTAYLHQQMNYVATAYAGPNYEKLPDGRRLCCSFGLEGMNIDWATLAKENPGFAMLFENSGGYTRTSYSAGAFAWVGNSPTNVDGCIESYQTHFLTAAASAAPGKITMASICKGFDDHARWTGADPTKSCWNYPNDAARFANEKQGQTFLNVIDILNKSTFKPQYVQLVTFNDHEEGTFVEWGIDSTLQCEVSMTGSVVTVSLTGNLNTVDSIYLFVDGNLATQLPPAASINIDLNTQITPVIPPGTHSLYAVALGKAFFQNKFSQVLTRLESIVWS